MHLCIMQRYCYDMTAITDSGRRFLVEKIIIEGFSEKYFPFDTAEKVRIRPLNDEFNENKSEHQESMVIENNLKDEVIETTSRAVTSFRVCEEGSIGYKRDFDDKDNSWKNIPEYGLPCRIPNDRQKTYKIEFHNLTKVQTVYQLIETIRLKQVKMNRERTNSSESPLILALSWFNRPFDEVYEDNMLIDLMICFEILFASSDSKKKGMPVAFLAAGFLDKQGNIDRFEMFSTLRLAYRIRNMIIHDGKRFSSITRDPKYSERVSNGWSFIKEIQCYARLCLDKYIRNYAKSDKTFEQFKKEIILQLN